MVPPDNPKPPGTHLLWAQLVDRTALGTVTLLALVATAAYWLAHGGHRGELIEIERPPAQRARFQLDLNQAAWPELALLPGIGETMARRIVESRHREGPFCDHTDLTRVPGIGPRTLERVKRYLLPVAGVETMAGQSGSVDRPQPDS